MSDVRSLLCESLFSVISFSNMRNADVIYYLLFLKHLLNCAKVFVKPSISELR